MKFLSLVSFFLFSVLVCEVKAESTDMENDVIVSNEGTLSIEDVRLEVDQEVSERINEKNEFLDTLIDRRTEELSNEINQKGQDLGNAVLISVEELKNVLNRGLDILNTKIDEGVNSLNMRLEQERNALHQKLDEDAALLRSEVSDILIREIKEYSEQSEYVVKSFFFDAIFTETPVCGTVDALDLTTEWVGLTTITPFGPLDNQINSLRFDMGTILRHFGLHGTTGWHAAMSNLHTAHHTGQVFCMAIYLQSDAVTTWIELHKRN